jgi:hypothetical protein
MKIRLAALVVALACSGCTGDGPAAPTPLPPPAPAAGSAVAIFLTPNTWDLPRGGGELLLTVATAASAAGNVSALHVVVTLTTTEGALSVGEIQTDATGHALVTWTGTRSAIVTARAGDTIGTAQIRVAP